MNEEQNEQQEAKAKNAREAKAMVAALDVLASALEAASAAMEDPTAEEVKEAWEKRMCAAEFAAECCLTMERDCRIPKSQGRTKMSEEESERQEARARAKKAWDAWYVVKGRETKAKAALDNAEGEVSAARAMWAAEAAKVAVAARAVAATWGDSK